VLKSSIVKFAAAGILALFATAAGATQVLGFSQNSSSNTVTATQNGGSTATSISIVDVPITVTNYLGGGTPIAALINLTATSSNDAIITGVLIHQNFTGTFCITSGPACTGTNYLSGTFVDVLAGVSGGSQFTMGSSTPPGTDVTFISDILSPAQLQEARALALSFSNVIAPIGICGTTICSFTASQSGTMSANNTVLPPAQLGVVKTPDNGTFTPGSQVSFTIVVSNTAASGSQPATNVTLSDQLPGNGGLVWSSASTTQGSCTTPIVGNLLNCALGTIPPQGSVTVTVTSGPTTPAAACQSQPNPVALATADNGLSAQDSGSLICTPIIPPAPGVTTAASAGVAIGGAVSDAATLSGAFNATGTITFRLFGPNDATCSSPAVFTSTIPVSGNGSYASASFTPTAVGTYRWIANYSGDANNPATANACNAANESVVVTGTSPGVATMASAGVAVGGAVSDAATLSGAFNATGTITFRLFGPNDATCSSPAVFSSTIPVSGNGSYASASFTPTAAGTYRWIANYNGDANNPATANACNAANESVVVTKSVTTLVTQASPRGAAGAPIGDTATLSGGINPTGTITFALYGPDDATCSKPAIFTLSLAVNGNGTFVAEGFKPTTAGTYGWIASYSGDAGNLATANTCNAAGQAVTVAATVSTPTEPIPTLSEWALVLLLLLLGASGVRAVGHGPKKRN